MTSFERFVSLAGGLATIIVLLARMAYQVGALVRSFTDHVSGSREIHIDTELRIRKLEKRRK